MKLALALSAEEARKSKELDIGNKFIILTYFVILLLKTLYFCYFCVEGVLYFYSMSELIESMRFFY